MKNLTFFFALALLLLFSNLVESQTHKGPFIDGVNGEKLGQAVCMPDGNTIAVAAATFNPWNGYVKVYEWNGTTWSQKGQNLEGEAGLDGFGKAISMPDANTIAIGANKNDGIGEDAGHVRIYEWSGTEWIQKGLDINGEAAGDESGWSVSMPDVNTVAIGAFRNDGNGTQAGHTRIYEWNGNAWIPKGLDIEGETAIDRSGFSVSMPNANTIAIGAPYNDDNGFDSGHVRIYEWNGTAWTQKGIDIDGEAGDDRSGCAVSMPDANTVAIGAFRNDGNGSASGHVRIYEWNGTIWTQKGIDIDGEASDNWSGTAVSMPDANTVAIGSPLNGNNGHVRIYGWNGTAWTQKGIDIDGVNSGSRFGNSVSMPNAHTIAATTNLSTTGGIGSGYVRVYTLPILVSSIAVQGEAGASTITTLGGTLQMEASVLPMNADDATYIWSVSNGTGSAMIDQSGLLTAMTDGTVMVTATANDASGITGTADITISNQTSDINEQSFFHNLSISPNPVSTQILIDTEAKMEAITIIDVTGKTVKKIVEPNNTIDVSDLSKGIYFLQFQIKNSLVSRKIIKE